MTEGPHLGVVSRVWGAELMLDGIVIQVVAVEKVAIDLSVGIFSRWEVRTELWLRWRWRCEHWLRSGRNLSSDRK
jgi:hypothetical protein